MDLGLKELGITLIVGAFAILGAAAIAHFFSRRPLIGFFQRLIGLLDSKQLRHEEGAQPSSVSPGKHWNENQVVMIAVYVALAFAIGIFVENLSAAWIEVPQAWKNSITGNNLNSRVSLLVSDYTESSDSKHKWGLTKDLTRNDAFLITDPQNGEKVQKWIRCSQPRDRVETWLSCEDRCKPGDTPSGMCPSRKEVDASIGKLYYYAKNRVYAQPNYFEEMRKIQSRQEFASSVAVISFFYFVIAAAIGLILVSWLALSGRRTSNRRELWRKLRIRVPSVVLTLLVVCFFSLWTYEKESDEFHKRTYGYYSSMLILEKIQKDDKMREILAGAKNESETVDAFIDTSPANR